MNEIKISQNIFLRPSSWGRGIEVVRNGEVAGRIPVPVPRNKNVYITLHGEKPQSEEEAEKRVGKDVLKLIPDEVMKIAVKLGIFKTSEDDEKRARNILAMMIFEHGILDGMDEFASKLKLKLNNNEWNAVKKYFYYDGDCEAWLTREPLKVTEELIHNSKRFTEAFAYLLYMNSIIIESHATDLFNYIKYYNLHNIIVDYAIGQEETIENMKEKYSFTGNLQTIESNSNLVGHNTGRYEFERKNGKTLVVLSYAVPPDDYAVESLVIKDEKTINISTIDKLFSIARVKDDIEKYNKIYKMQGE